MRLAKQFMAAFVAVAITSHGVAAPQNIEKTAHGLVLHFGQAQVELAAASTNTLRLSVSLDGTPRPAPTTFLADTNADFPVAWQSVKRHGLVGVQTAAGTLLMNPENGDWTLENARGKTLIPRHAIGNLAATGSNASVNVTLGWKKGQPIQVYGCGNGVNALEQSKTTTGLGNGRAVLPYYWSEAGYSVLAVTADDNRPAHWLAATNDAALTWIFPGTTADLYLTPAANLKDAARVYAQLTGHAPVPPLWAFGYMQSRWGWRNRAYIDDTLQKFHDLKIPVDVFIFDFEWYAMHPDYSLPADGLPGFADFGWNTNLFSDPAGQIKAYKDQGVHSVGIRKPRMGNPEVLAMARAKGWTIFGSNHMDHVQAREMRFDNPDFREWYVAQSAPLLQAGIDGWWNDEGESQFTLYFYWNSAEKEALNRYRPGQRLWTLNRAFSPGLQRLGAAAWTGDIKSSWAMLASTPTSLLNWNLAGLPYEVCDIGGYAGNPSPQLLSRWMEAGAFFPVMRSHSELNSTPRFPWLYGSDALDAIRKAIELRYRLIPYYYSLAHETFATGLPLMRPLVMEFPDDPKVANLSDEWLMGPSLLAAPILHTNDTRTVYLPAGGWYAFESNVPLKGGQSLSVTAKLDEIPVYVRAGAILPLAPAIQHTSELPGGALDLQIYPGKDATFTLAEDDGETTDYLQGQVRRTTFQWDDAKGQLTWARAGNYDGKNVFQNVHVTVFAPAGKLQAEGPLNDTGSLAPK